MLIFSFIIGAFCKCHQEDLPYDWYYSDNETCHGILIVYDNYTKCKPANLYFYCDHLEFFSLSILVCLPTVIFIIISKITKTRVSKRIWVCNILLNLFWGYFVEQIPCYSVQQDMGPLIHGCIGGLLLIIYISFRIHSCCSTIQEENEVMVVKSLENQKQMGKSHDIGFLAEAKSKYMHLSDLYEIDNQNASNCGEIIYSKLESNDIVDVSYCTWQEDGDRQPLKGEKVIYTCIPVIDLDRTMDNTLNTAYNAYLSRFCESEANRFVKLRYKPPQNFVYRAIAGNSFAFKYFTTIPYRIFYEILFFFGFNGISDFFWSYKAKRYIFYSQKKIGHEASSYRARYGERDLNPIINHEGGEISENYNSSKDENSMKMSLLNPYNENY